MKRLYLLSVATLVAGVVTMLSLEASAGPKAGHGKKIDPSAKKFDPSIVNTIKPIPAPPAKAPPVGGGVSATGGTGGAASGTGAKGGNGGGAVAVGGNNNGTIINGNNNTINNITKVTNNNISFSPSFGGGGFGGGSVAVAGAGGDGSITGAPGVAIAATPAETGISTNGAPAIAQGADGKDNVNAEVAEREQVYTRRFLKVRNDADVPMKVFVQYRGMDQKKWAWLPADPSDSHDALVYDLKPGQEILVEHKSQKVAASRVRVWAAAAQAQNWFDYRDQDLWIVPELDQRGEHHYLATEMKTFTFIFPKLPTK